MTTPNDPLIIGLSGYADTSKEAVAQMLCEEHQFHARPVTALVERIASAAPTWDGRRGPAARATLWAKSSKLREAFGDDVLIADALRYPLPPRLVVVGVRLPVEASAIRDRGGIIVRLTRANVGPSDMLEADLCDADIVVDVTDITSAALHIAIAAARHQHATANSA